jgi:MFS family permease
MSQVTQTGAGARLFRLLVYGLILASAAAQFALVPVMPVYAHRLGLSGFQQGIVLGATGLAALAVSVPAGTLSDRFGARRITLAAGLLMASATLAQAFAGSFAALLAARLAFGVGYAMVWTAGLCWLADAAGGPTALGGSVASAGVGGVAGPAASGALTQHFGLAVPLLAGAAGFAVITAVLGSLRVPPGAAAPRRAAAAGLRAAARDRDIIGSAAAVVVAGLSTGACALLVPARLHAAGASPGQIGLDFAAAGILFAAGSALTAAAGRRAVNLPVICGGILALTAALSLGVLSTAPLAIVVMLCFTTAARSVLWTVCYPLAADAAGRGGTGLGAAVGLLNGIWAATAVLGPLAAGLAAEHLSARAAFGLTEAVCAAALVVTAAAAWPIRHPARRAARTVPGRDGRGRRPPAPEWPASPRQRLGRPRRRAPRRAAAHGQRAGRRSGSTSGLRSGCRTRDAAEPAPGRHARSPSTPAGGAPPRVPGPRRSAGRRRAAAGRNRAGPRAALPARAASGARTGCSPRYRGAGRAGR